MTCPERAGSPARPESGQADAKAEVLDPLEPHTHLLLGTTQLFTCVYLAERT